MIVATRSEGDKESVNDFEEEKLNRRRWRFQTIPYLKEMYMKTASFRVVLRNQSMNFLSLNIQGLAQKAKKDWAKELCVKNKVNFLAIQETKMEEIDLFEYRRCLGYSTFEHLHSNSVAIHNRYFLESRAHDYGPVPFDFFTIGIISIGALMISSLQLEFRPLSVTLMNAYLAEGAEPVRCGIDKGTVLSCLTSSKGSILVNGCPTNEFQFYKGLKQGDPLSPFLFILVMESLHLSFQRIVNAGMFKGIVLDQSLCLSHMFYADDAIFLGEWSDGNISTLIHVLKCFFHASGLKINLNKSKIMGINVESAQVIQAAAKLGCLVLKCPFYYLGTKWEVLHILESIRSHFFNGHDPGSKKASWVKWNNVLTDKKRGGLVIVAIHGVGGKIHSEWTSTGKSCWLSILSEVRSLQRKGMYIFDYLTHKMGNGESTKFWLDHWHTRGIFKDIFPRLYALESSKDVTVSSKIGDTSLVCSFRRIPRGGIEQNQFHRQCLVEIGRSVTIVPSG
ncbi:RNA-directed DNA polymerase, eukaryota, reverse transcriptase zinc-binding domain protein [Tanacetum coccineum]|uniref:RNA-directed DNA polymerase, eukaryota, reverse transcriptase zinc-binding domain protein n=1 Tax=Tanacetum coccineum TaxID=301880 RepID=A0ABQ5CEL9_9ASTR